jgi:hypothetical protein
MTGFLIFAAVVVAIFVYLASSGKFSTVDADLNKAASTIKTDSTVVSNKAAAAATVVNDIATKI